MKKMNNVIRQMKNVVFDLLVIVGGLAVIVLIGKAFIKNGNDAKTEMTTVRTKAAEVTNDEAKYSEAFTEFIAELDAELDEELYSGEGKENNKEKINYEKNVDYLGSGMYKVVYTFNIYGNDELTYVAYVDIVEEDGVGAFVLNGIRIDESVLDDIYPGIF